MTQKDGMGRGVGGAPKTEYVVVRMQLEVARIRDTQAMCSHCSLPWTWGISSQPLQLTLDVVYLLSAAPCSRAAQLLEDRKSVV